LRTQLVSHPDLRAGILSRRLGFDAAAVGWPSAGGRAARVWLSFGLVVRVVGQGAGYDEKAVLVDGDLRKVKVSRK
jgi:hypothetical protein